MEVRLTATAAGAAEEAADLVAARAVEAITARGRFVWAVSGGSTPAAFLSALATRERVDWAAFHLFQVDERIASAGSTDRNDTMIRERFVGHRPEVDYRPLPVDADDLGSALADHLTDIGRVAAPRPASIWCSSAWATTATPPRWSPAIRCSVRPTTSR